MGLDMYLYRKNDKAADFEQAKKMNDAFWKGCHWDKNAGKFVSDEYERGFEEIGYLRKANMIHKWFADNCGADDCEYYPVSRAQMEKLLETCKTVLENTVLVDGMVENGKVWSGDRWKPIMEEGKYILDSSVAEELLPTCSGFFFGGTDYDQWYVRNVEDTVEIVGNVLNDYDDVEFYYYPSW